LDVRETTKESGERYREPMERGQKIEWFMPVNKSVLRTLADRDVRAPSLPNRRDAEVHIVIY
jgi:hypothetical protein